MRELLNPLFDPMCLEGCSKLAAEELLSSAAGSPMIIFVIAVAGAAFIANRLVKILF